MDLPNETLNNILHHLLKDANINFGEAQTTIELTTDPYRCKALCITEVNKRLFDLAWIYLNTNCTFTSTYLPEQVYETMTQFHINQDGDMVELNDVVSFRQVANLTVDPWQHYYLETRAKHNHPLLIRFPKLQQISLRHWAELTVDHYPDYKTERAFTNPNWWRPEDEDSQRVPSQHRLLSEVKIKVIVVCTLHILEVSDDILDVSNGFPATLTSQILTLSKNYTETITTRESEVLSAGYADTALWKDLFPEIKWQCRWSRGGIRYVKWASAM